MKDTLVFNGSDNPGMLREIEAFRFKVWKRLIDSHVASARFRIDRFDYEGWHVVYLDEGDIVASARLTIAADEAGVPDLCSFAPHVQQMSFPIGILNRLVVHWEHAGIGVGRRMNVDRIKLAARQGVSEVWVEVQTGRVASMQRLGFEELGPSQDTTITGDWRIMRRIV